MKIGIYGQHFKKESSKYINVLLHVLEKNNVSIYIEKEFLVQIKAYIKLKKDYPTFSNHTDLDNTFDLLLSAGGDGTFLRAITYIRDLDIPILGINLGRLGFLAIIPKDKIEVAITSFLKNDYTITKRSLLKVKAVPEIPELEEINIALNEVTVVRKETTAMITLETYLDDEYLSVYWADGLIIATPTGSTGYSLSCGGPVISPTAKNLVITPIAPHNLNVRPLVISDKTKIKLKLKGREKEALISLDSRIISIPKETEVFIEKTDFNIQTILPNDQSFLKTLREKLLWGKDTRNR